MDWQDRFIERKMMSAGELAKKYNRQNYRLHPESQRNTVEASLDQTGWFDEVSYSPVSDQIFDGHLRVELTIEKYGPDALVPVKMYDLDEAETQKALLLKDTTTGMAEIDLPKFEALWGEVDFEVPEFSSFVAGEFSSPDENKADREISPTGRLYNAGEGHDIEPFKLAYRVEAAYKSRGDLALDLFSGEGQLATWYRRRFDRVITVDKNLPRGDVDYSMPADIFIRSHINDFIDFDFIDFDDEGTPAREIQTLFSAIEGKRTPFVLCLTDGNGLNLRYRGHFDFRTYLIENERSRPATRQDYDDFENMVTGFIYKVSAGFKPAQISSYRGRQNNVVYQTWLMTPA
jgi:hypothetical protein